MNLSFKSCLLNFEDPESLVEQIKAVTAKKNLDNISRTKAYQQFHFCNDEFRWPFLASMVSRNAGWNMGDLQLREFRSLMSCEARRWIFYAYERANWLIFADAYPQLLLYEASKKARRPLFHLLKRFNVSGFMEEEWVRFWNSKDEKRLDTALIINEQHVIQQPVLEHPSFKETVFTTIPFWMQERVHFSTVLFPTMDGEVFGMSVHGFKKISNRIKLGKRLLALLSDPQFYGRFIHFAKETEPTGSRSDFEQYLSQKVYKGHGLPLRVLFPIIEHHRSEVYDWSYRKTKTEKYFQEVRLPNNFLLNGWYEHKRMELHLLSKLKSQLNQ